MKIKNTDARLLTIHEARTLINYSNNMPENLNTEDCTDLQAILDMYHNQDGWDGFDTFIGYDHNNAMKIYNNILQAARIRRENEDNRLQKLQEDSQITARGYTGPKGLEGGMLRDALNHRIRELGADKIQEDPNKIDY